MAIITKTSAHTNINTSSTPATTDSDDFILINTGSAITTTHLINGAAGVDSIVVGGTTATAQTFNFGAGITNIEDIVIGNVSGNQISSLGTVSHTVNAALVTSALNITGNAGSNVIQGGLAGDTISGNAGNDNISGNAGNDSINGGDGNDILNGGTGTDTLVGGAGNDIFVVSKGSDVTIGERIQGGTELDEIRFGSTTANDTLTLGNSITGIENIAIGTGTAAAAVVTGTLALNVNASLVANSLNITGNAGANRITATGFDDSINGGAGKDVINAGAGNDTIVGDAGADSLIGGAGDDTYIYNAIAEFAAGESITDTAGNDKVIFNGTGTLVLNNLVTGIDQITIGQTTASINVGGVNASTVVSNGLIISGNAAANTIIGTVGSDLILGGAGNDVINGGNGDDLIVGGLGADSLSGGAGDDFISNGEAVDSIDGGAGYDNMTLNASYVQANNAGLVGVEQIDLQNSGSINLNLTGQTEGFRIYDNDYASTITGGSGNDAIIGSGGIDSFKGGAGNDVIYGSQQDALIDGGLGSDTLILQGNFTQTNNAALIGIETIDVDYYAVNIDLTGQTEAFTINGNDYDDTITGGAGADTINGGSGDDTIIINSVANYAVGDVINGGEDFDIIEINVDATDADATIQLVNVSNVEHVRITGATNINLDASLVSDRLEIIGNEGDNYITGTNADDYISGGSGNDLLVGGDGEDMLELSNNLADYTISKAGDLYTITDNVGNDGTDTFTGFESFYFRENPLSIDEINAVAFSAISPSDDVIDDANEVTGTDANEFANLGAGNDTVNGGAGNDILNGQAGDDSIDGGPGNDTLTGGAGNDTLTGGLGNDTFNVDSGTDTITKLNIGDTLNVSADAMAIVEDIDYLSGGIANNGTVTLNSHYAYAIISLIGATGTNGFTVNLGEESDTTNVTGSANADTINGGGSNNHYAFGGNGDDIITGGSGSNFLYGGDGDDSITGAAAADTLNGGADNDTLVGGADNAVDSMTGGTGDDIYVINFSSDAQSGDQVYENADEGTDTIVFDFYSYNLEANFENLVLAEDTGAIVGGGNELNNVITGNSNNNDLTGGAGSDIITGGAGSDSIHLGDDGYADTVVQNLGDGTAITFNDAGGFIEEDVGNGSINQYETFAVAGIDRIDGFGPGDSFSFGALGADYQLGTFANGTIENNSYYFVGGQLAGNFDDVFGTAGDIVQPLDTLVIYDADATAGIDMHAIVLEGMNAGNLTAGTGGLDFAAG